MTTRQASFTRSRIVARTRLPVAALALSLTLAVQAAHAGHIRVLHDFSGAPDGAVPLGGVFEDASGNLYGTTSQGGTKSCYGGSLGCGVLYRLAPDGTETILHTFNDTGDANDPWDPPMMDASGNLFGTSASGGANITGTVYRIASDGTESVLYSFPAFDGDGFEPAAKPIMDGAGNLYGTTTNGGKFGYGIVFKLAPDGTESVLHSFSEADGEYPYVLGGLLTDRKGDLFGTSFSGGGVAACQGFSGCGTVWKLKPDGSLVVLHAFQGGADGLSPVAGLLRDRAGNFYGTTLSGGGGSTCTLRQGCGVVFKLAPDGTETILHAFAGGEDGAQPYAPLIFDRAGNLYGSTNCFDDRHSCYSGLGCFGHTCGTIFRIAPDGTETVLHVFKGGNDGGGPVGALIIGAHGRLFGTASEAGSKSGGTIFSVAR